ncbi:calcium/sodium antiporter [Legionella israelensis]|uniref:Na/Ca antiporter n=1 Tax=Legionella israelensis TaxID=454 RepID=A0A0W0W228_9GAMM|nr:calcium/sodium antiporter [Legionella israelensis]KTD26285.1 Na/Ca antiporter [Legionella israelensis]SCY33386.1 cation:H+ antiporter [Legionella israelensis DSM 19235]STX57761.1 Ca2 /Na antiporter [Legionella israelensis]
MLLTTLTLIISLFFLLWSAHHLVIGSSGIAQYYRIPPLFIGLTIVAIGTTAPEIMVSITAAIHGKSDIALGNAIGSNIANIGLIIGIITLIRPLKTQSRLLQREYPILFIIMLFAYILFIDNYLSRIDGLLLLLGSVILMIYFAYASQKIKKEDPLIAEFKEILSSSRSLKTNIFSIILGIIILPVSARFLVNSASEIAAWMGISELIIGLTILAIGTSLPELATSAVAAIKHEDDISIGNILGSNMFNILLVIAFPGIINPNTIPYSVIWRDIPVMFVLTAALLIFNIFGKKQLRYWHGGLLLLIYLFYFITIVLNATL